VYKFAKKIENLQPYEPITESYRIRLDANESFIPPDPALFNDLGAALNRYPDPYASELRQAFADFYGISAEDVVAGNGSDELIALIFSCLMEKGENSLTFNPDFSMYGIYPGLYELNVHMLNKRGDFTIDIDAACEYCKTNAIRCVMLANPCNPTSLLTEGKSLLKLTESADLVVIDEAYMDFCPDKSHSLLHKVNDFDNLIVLKTASKSGFAGLRLGFAVSNRRLADKLTAVKSPYNVNMLSQIVGTRSYRDVFVQKSNIEAITRSAQDLCRELKQLHLTEDYRVLDTSANFVAMITGEAGKIDAYLRKNGISVRKYSENLLRITAGNEYENSELIAALRGYKNEN
jgi:histidinol-phosphate aminotransferase